MKEMVFGYEQINSHYGNWVRDIMFCVLIGHDEACR